MAQLEVEEHVAVVDLNLFMFYLCAHKLLAICQITHCIQNAVDSAFLLVLYASPVILLPFTVPEIFTFYQLFFPFPIFEWCSEVALYTLQLLLHITIHIYSQPPFFLLSIVCANTAVLYTQVCKHALLSRCQMLLCYI